MSIYTLPKRHNASPQSAHKALKRLGFLSLLGLCGLTGLSCKRPQQLALEQLPLNPKLGYTESTASLPASSWQLTRDQADLEAGRGLCLIGLLPEAQRAIVAHTHRPCDEARFERGRITLWDTSRGEPLASFYTWLSGDERSPYLVVQAQENAPHALLSIKTGQLIAPSTANSSANAQAQLALLIPPKSTTLWLFESVPNADGSFKLSFGAHDLNQALPERFHPTHPALFWPEDGLDLMRQPDPTTLFLERTSTTPTQDCALAKYTTAGQATCIDAHPAMQDHRARWYSAAKLRLQQDKTTQALGSAPWGQPKLTPLSDLKQCTPERVKLSDDAAEGATPAALYQCAQDPQSLHLWTPEQRFTLPKQPWLFVSPTPTIHGGTWQSLIVKNGEQVTLRAVADLQHQKLWALPDQMTRYSPRLILSSQGHISLLETKPRAAISPLDALKCPQKLIPTHDQDQWIGLTCPTDPPPTACTPPRAHQTKALLYDLGAKQRWAFDANITAITPQRQLVLARQAARNASGQLCPAHALQLYTLP